MSRLGEALTELDEPPVAALVVFDANPAASNPNQLRVREGLARDDLFTVVLEHRLDRHDRLRGRRAPGHDATGARRPARRLRPPLPVLERAGRRPAGRVPAEYGDLPPAGRRPGPRPPAPRGLRYRACPAAARQPGLPPARDHARAPARARVHASSARSSRERRRSQRVAFQRRPARSSSWPTRWRPAARILSSATCRLTRRATTSWPSASRSS